MVTDNTHQEHRVLTVAETAERLRLSEKKIRQLIRTGTLRSLRSVRPYLLPIKAVERYEAGE